LAGSAAVEVESRTTRSAESSACVTPTGLATSLRDLNFYGGRNEGDQLGLRQLCEA